MTEPIPATTAVRSRPPRGLGRSLLIGAIIGAFGACGLEIGRMVTRRNHHTVMPGRLYRSAQLKPHELERFITKNNIATVINLRGRPPSDWYPLEARATQKTGVSQEDVTTSANRMPSPMEIRRLIEIYDRTDYPILIHCQQGADRTGLAASIWLLLYSDADYAVARRHCMPRFGHFPILSTVAMDRFFDMYEAWLAERSAGHSPARFREWATTQYEPGPYLAELTLIEPPVRPEIGKPFALRIRAKNLTRTPWQMTAGSGFGVHATCVVTGPGGWKFSDRAGFMDRTVPPGEAVELTLAIPALPTAGKYQAFIDLAQNPNQFAHFGSEPITYDWIAVEPRSLPKRP